MNIIKSLFNEEKGNALVLVSLLLSILLGIGGLVIDGGTLYTTKAHLQKAANAAALSGAQELTADSTVIEGIVNNVLQSHNEQGSLVSMTIEPEQKVSVHLQKNIPLTFMSLFGFQSAPVETRAAATILSMGHASGAAPLGIDEATPLNYFQEYKLKVDQTGVDTGNFGVLALGGTGSKTYEENLKYGYSEEISIGDIIETQTGNISGKTRTVIQERIDACPYPVGDYSHRDCSRILLVPVYRPYNHNVNQLMSIKVTGFAYFYITQPMSSHDTSITGMFIKRVGTGIGDVNSANRGAYSIKLVE
ncbi:MAG: pilus assembly protein TadG-related protein [Bacillota bacterium]